MASRTSSITALESAYRRMGRGAANIDAIVDHLRRLRTDDLVYGLNRLGSAAGGCRGKEGFWEAATIELRGRLNEMVLTRGSRSAWTKNIHQMKMSLICKFERKLLAKYAFSHVGNWK